MQYRSQVVDFILYKNGEDGQNGLTPYIHIKYSNDGGATFTANNGETPGDYMGVYSDFTEDDSLVLSKYKWTKIKGEQGIQGNNGEDGTSVRILGEYDTEEELLSAHPTGNPGDSYLVSGNLYTWLDSKWTCVGNIQGPQGEAGVSGQGVESITPEYYISTSKEAPTGGEWSKTMPTWKVGTYLWIRNEIIYSIPTTASTDGTDTKLGTPTIYLVEPVYTEPYCDSSWEAVNEIEFGGRNYILRTNVSKYFSEWVPYIDASTLSLVDGYLKSTPNDSVYYNGVYGPKMSNLEAGTEYTLSFDAYADSELTLNYCYIMCDDGNKSFGIYIPITTTSAKYTHTFTTDKAYADCSIMIANRDSTNGVSTPFYLKNLKVEKGNKATDWTEAPEDIEYENSQSLLDAVDGIDEKIDEAKDNIEKALDIIYSTEESFNARMDEIDSELGKSRTDFVESLEATNTALLNFEEVTNARLDEIEDGVNIDTGTETGDPKIIIKPPNSVFSLVLQGNRISFIQGNYEVAYISESKIFIEDAQFLGDLRIGNFAFIPRSNGSLDFKKVSDGGNTKLGTPSIRVEEV